MLLLSPPDRWRNWGREFEKLAQGLLAYVTGMKLELEFLTTMLSHMVSCPTKFVENAWGWEVCWERLTTTLNELRAILVFSKPAEGIRLIDTNVTFITELSTWEVGQDGGNQWQLQSQTHLDWGFHATAQNSSWSRITCPPPDLSFLVYKMGLTAVSKPEYRQSPNQNTVVRNKWESAQRKGPAPSLTHKPVGLGVYAQWVHWAVVLGAHPALW